MTTPIVRRVSDDPRRSPAPVSDTNVVVGAQAFLVDDSIVIVVVKADRHIQCSDLLTSLGAAVVRPLQARDILLAFRLGLQPDVTYIDSELLNHDHLDIHGPTRSEHNLQTPQDLVTQLAARPLSLRLRT